MESAMNPNAACLQRSVGNPVYRTLEHKPSPCSHIDVGGIEIGPGKRRVAFVVSAAPGCCQSSTRPIIVVFNTTRPDVTLRSRRE
ncbi:hypothetical protein Mal65_08210 [Crateriforma conspicua]|nr:hypothetical protein Mal65_08210 [Crateriforma conspicua]